VDWAEANREFFASAVWRTVTDVSGRRIVKYPTDLWVFQEVIRASKPHVIVETGSAEGGSAYWFAQFAEVISVDLVAPDVDRAGVTWVEGDSTDPDVVATVVDLVAGRRCLVTLDSDHRAPHVAAELKAYAHLVAPGSYLVVEDTAVDVYGLDTELYPDGGPFVAVERFLMDNAGFETDMNCERFRLGMNPGGWLRRVA